MLERTARIELVCGIAAGVLGIVSWLVWLLVPLHRVYAADYGYTQVVFTSPVDSLHGLIDFIRLYPIESALILVFMLLVAVVAFGAYVHAKRRVSDGRLVVWCGTILVVLAMPLLDLPTLQANIVDPASTLLLLGLGLCVALAVVSSVMAIGVESSRLRAGAPAHE